MPALGLQPTGLRLLGPAPVLLSEARDHLLQLPREALVYLQQAQGQLPWARVVLSEALAQMPFVLGVLLAARKAQLQSLVCFHLHAGVHPPGLHLPAPAALMLVL